MKPTAAPTTSNPLIVVAAVALIVASLVAIAAMSGILPSAQPASEQESSANEAVMQSKRLAGVRDDGTAAPAGGRAGNQVAQTAVARACASCGVIQNVRAVHDSGQGSGLGAVAGGVGGAVVGSQLGRGNGRTALGVLGAVGGAFAGNAIERNLRGHTRYHVSVLMEDGTERTIYSAAPPAFAVGEAVRVVDGRLTSAHG